MKLALPICLLLSGLNVKLAWNIRFPRLIAPHSLLYEILYIQKNHKNCEDMMQLPMDHNGVPAMHVCSARHSTTDWV